MGLPMQMPSFHSVSVLLNAFEVTFDTVLQKLHSSEEPSQKIQAANIQTTPLKFKVQVQDQKFSSSAKISIL